jgi:hypothetical protein
MSVAEDKGVSGWSSCPSCQFLVNPDAPRCPFCGADLARSAPASAAPAMAAPAAGWARSEGSSLPPPPLPPPLGAGVPPPPVGWLGGTSSGTPPMYFAPPTGSAKRTIASVAVVGVTLVLALIAAVTFLGGGEENPYPDAWDPRILPLADFVANERGLVFEHPVYVDFLEKAAFDEDMTADSGPTDEERAELDQYEGLYRAFGLVNGDIDLFDTSNELMSDGVAAYYSPETKRITVNGATLDAATRVTVVHELTHALQDQHFDLIRLENGLDDATSETFTAVIEGDATRIDARYYDQLTEAEMAEADAAYEADGQEADYGRFPRVIVAQFGAPYAFGEPFLAVLDAAKGAQAVNDAIITPPRSMEQVLDPFAYLDGDQPAEVAVPALSDGEQEFENGTLGALFLFLVLNERIGAKEALAVADGWAGDSYVAFTRDGTTCVRANIAAESPDALLRLGNAVNAWAAGMPAGSAQVTLDDDLSLETCDPGAAAAIPPPVTPDIDPLTAPATRLYIAQGVMEGGWTVDEARCIVGAYFGSLSIEQIVSDSDANGEALDALGAAAVTTCTPSG